MSFHGGTLGGVARPVNRKLSERDTDCLRLAASGMISKEIGVRLGMSERMVERHLLNCRQKLSAKNTVEAVYRWLMHQEMLRKRGRKNPDSKITDCLVALFSDDELEPPDPYHQPAMDHRRRHLSTAQHKRRAWLRAATGGSHTTAEWTALLRASGGKCFYCGRGDVPMTRDHKVPLARGGENAIDNIVPACLQCNSRKNVKTAEEFMALRAK